MTTYDSYEAAKIANPDKAIHKHCVNEEYATREASSLRPRDFLLAECSPADHCMTVEKFLADGNKFSGGDAYLSLDGFVINYVLNMINSADDTKRNSKRYILRAAALEEKKPRTKVEWIDVHHTEAVYYFTQTDDMYAEPDESQKYDDLQDYINNLEESGSSSLYRRIETPMTERDELLEALQLVWIIDGVDGQEQLEKIVDSGLFKIVN